MRKTYRIATTSSAGPSTNEGELVDIQKGVSLQITKYVVSYLQSGYPEASQKVTQSQLLQRDLELRTGVAVSEMISELIEVFSNVDDD